MKRNRCGVYIYNNNNSASYCYNLRGTKYIVNTSGDLFEENWQENIQLRNGQYYIPGVSFQDVVRKRFEESKNKPPLVTTTHTSTTPIVWMFV